MKDKILDLVSEYCKEEFKPKPFQIGKDKVGVGWPCYSDEELRGAIGTILDLGLSQGPKVKKFEELYYTQIIPSFCTRQIQYYIVKSNDSISKSSVFYFLSSAFINYLCG